MLFLVALGALQQVTPLPSSTTPPSGDTVGYWQQHVHYRIVATLDEAAQTLHARGDLVYVNHSPDTLREMYVHQYLNAFRPGSRWSGADAREGRVRYQRMRDPDYAYERFTAPVTVDGASAAVDYPGAPDSTVAHFALTRPLRPGDSVRVHFEWDARPSTLPRRQGRRGRHYDFAQWYPKVAVYDRGGWQPNALVPAGELYGEFGTYDVSIVVRDDQVLGATGVVVSGDPGWRRVRQGGVGSVNMQPAAYQGIDEAPAIEAPTGFRVVRFVARDVHHFAWTASPDYRYEGALYDGRIAVHVLYRPGDEKEWGADTAVQRTETALRWLESIYGRYAYPQVTNVHRLDGGGTEFPMMIMNGSAWQGLIYHELGHIYTYGMLANNEWRSGWMDEGLTSYQSAWAERRTPQDRAGGESAASPPPRTDYRRHAVLPAAWELFQIDLYNLDLTGRDQPIGTRAQDFRDFAVYNLMIYSRAQQMYGALRDAIGDSAFSAFLHLYFERWKLKHVDELAMRQAAEDASGQKLGWFFDEWVHRTGLIDYALTDVRTAPAEGAGEWITRARVLRLGAYVHPVPVGVHTSRGWTVQRVPASSERVLQVEVRTPERPLEIRLDPDRVTEDWDRRNDVLTGSTRYVFDWPFLKQYERERQLVALSPLAWYSRTGGVTAAVRVRSNYQGLVDERELGLALSEKLPRYPSRVDSLGRYAPGEQATGSSRVQGWAVVENPRIGQRDPLIGVRAGLWALDGIARGELRKRWDKSPLPIVRPSQVTRTLALGATFPYDSKWLDFERWSDVSTLDLTLDEDRQASSAIGVASHVRVVGGWSGGQHARALGGALYGVAELELKKSSVRGARGLDHVRVYLGLSDNTPLQRSIGVAALDGFQTFENHLLRPAGSVLSPYGSRNVHYEAIGGAALRGYSPLLRVRQLGTGNIAAANLELTEAVNRPRIGSLVPQFRLGAFGDAGLLLGPARLQDATLVDGGVGLSARGRLFDRTYAVRVDQPLYVRQPLLAVGGPDVERVKLRWAFSFRDLW